MCTREPRKKRSSTMRLKLPPCKPQYTLHSTRPHLTAPHPTSHHMNVPQHNDVGSKGDGHRRRPSRNHTHHFVVKGTRPLYVPTPSYCQACVIAVALALASTLTVLHVVSGARIHSTLPQNLREKVVLPTKREQQAHTGAASRSMTKTHTRAQAFLHTRKVCAHLACPAKVHGASRGGQEEVQSPLTTQGHRPQQRTEVLPEGHLPSGTHGHIPQEVLMKHSTPGSREQASKRAAQARSGDWQADRQADVKFER